MLTGSGTTITDGGAVALWGDKSGNSGVNALIIPGVTGNDATLAGIGALGTSDFTVVAKFKYAATSGSTDQSLVRLPAATNGFSLLIKNGTSRIQATKAGVGYVSATSASNLSTYTIYTVAYVRSGTTGTYYVNGVADGTATDNFDYTATGLVSIGLGGGAATNLFIYEARVYSAALDATGVLADYNGTVQANCVVNVNFALAGKRLANGDTFTATTGGTVTLNSSGATGARIAGERDLFQGTLANRPVYLAYQGTKYGWLNSAANADYFSCPDADLNALGDFSVVTKVRLPDYTPSAIRCIVSKAGTTTTRTTSLFVDTNGTVIVTISDDGTAKNVTSSAALGTVGFTDNADGYIAYTRKSSDGEVKIWVSLDGSSWTQLGTALTGVTGALYTSTGAPVIIGKAFNSGGGGEMIGKVYEVSIYSGIVTDFATRAGGTLLKSFNPSLYTSGTTFTASTGEVWTINGGAHIVTRTGLYFDGSNDYLKTAAFSLSQPETVYATLGQVSWTVNDIWYDGGAFVSGCVQQITGSPQVDMYAGSYGGTTVSPALQTCVSHSTVFNGASSSHRINRGALASGNAGASSMAGVTVGSSANGTNNANEVVSEFAVYSVAHTQAIRDRMALYAGRKHGFAV